MGPPISTSRRHTKHATSIPDSQVLLYRRSYCCLSLDPRFMLFSQVPDSENPSSIACKEGNIATAAIHSSPTLAPAQSRLNYGAITLMDYTVLFSIFFPIKPTVLIGQHHAQASNRLCRSQELHSANGSWSSCECKSKCEACWACPITPHAVKLPVESRNHAAAFANAQSRHCTVGVVSWRNEFILLQWVRSLTTAKFSPRRPCFRDRLRASC